MLLLIAAAAFGVWNEAEHEKDRVVWRLGGIVLFEYPDWLPQVVRSPLAARGQMLPYGIMRPAAVGFAGPRPAGSGIAALAEAAEALGVTQVSISGGQADDLAPLGRLPGLRDLYLREMTGVSGRTTGLAPAVALQSLNLVGSDVTDADLVPLARLPNLTSLALSGTRVTDAGLPTLAAMPSLRSVWLRGNRVSEPALDALAARRPDLWIRRGSL